LISFFRTPQDLAALVTPAVYRQEMKRQMGLESLPVHSISGIENAEITSNQHSASHCRLDRNLGLGYRYRSGRLMVSTRLYFLSYLAVRLTQIEVIVFVSAGVGVANPTIVKERLEKFYPPLFGSDPQNNQTISQSAASGDLSTEVQRRTDEWKAYMGKISEASLKTFVTKRQLKEWLGPT
jgi:hypothetical protein